MTAPMPATREPGAGRIGDVPVGTNPELRDAITKITDVIHYSDDEIRDAAEMLMNVPHPRLDNWVYARAKSTLEALRYPG